MASTPAPAAAPAASPAPPAHQVFVGNIPFVYRDADLVTLIQGAGVTPKNARVVYRGNRSAGYAFVEFNSDEEAKKAVAALHKKQVDGRDINVEMAKGDGTPRTPSAPSSSGGSSSGDKPARRTGGGGGAGGNAAGTSSGGPPSGDGGAGGRGRGRGRGRGGRFRGGRGGGGGRGRPSNNTADRPNSTTAVFVANLPFDLEDQGLAAFFNPLQPKEARVIRRPNTGSSKGYGFVTFQTTADQTKALTKDKSKIGDREISVRIAKEPPPPKEDAPAAASSAAPAAAAPAGGR
jgi:RNA recognition motif-containing protein